MMIDFLIQCDTIGDIVKNLLGIMIELLILCDTVVVDIVKNLPDMMIDFFTQGDTVGDIVKNLQT